MSRINCPEISAILGRVTPECCTVDRVAGKLEGAAVDLGLGTRAITAEEGAPAEKRLFGVRTGVAVPETTKDVRFAPNLVLAFDARLESAGFGVATGVGFAIPTDDAEHVVKMGGLFFELGAYAYLTRTTLLAPYVGLGLAPLIDFGDLQESVTLPAYAQLGLTLGRQRRTHLAVELRAAKHLLTRHIVETTWDRELGSQERVTGRTAPFETSLAVALGW